VEIQGETLVGGVASHPAFANVVRTRAGLFDLQHDPEYRNILTYPSPTTGDPVAITSVFPPNVQPAVKQSGVIT
jgi:4-hydroxyphenylacetate 3-monooxygenase